jgi:hypothetical protein
MIAGKPDNTNGSGTGAAGESYNGMFVMGAKHLVSLFRGIMSLSSG